MQPSSAALEPRSHRPVRQRSRRGACALVAALVAPAGLVGSVAIGAGTASAAPALSTQTVTYLCEGAQRTFTVPPLVTTLDIVAQAGSTVYGTLPVNPGDTLLIDVGCANGYGGYRGGAGGAGGGSVAKDGTAGGGASTVRRGTTPLLVAGGNGGAGGELNAGTHAVAGGAGGLAGAPYGTNVAGFHGKQGGGKDPVNNKAGGLGGLGGTSTAAQGADGETLGTASGGGGGGGGGGFPKGGAGGKAGSLGIVHAGVAPDCCAGGGGGAGDSYVAPELVGKKITSTAGVGSVKITFQGVARSGPTTFDRCTGTTMDYVVPDIASATKVNVRAEGAEGASFRALGTRPQAGAIDATIDVKPGETLQVLVGCVGNLGTAGKAGTGGFGIVSGGAGGAAVGVAVGGSGGGGATGLRRGTTVLVVAAGSGGDGGFSVTCTAGPGGNADGDTATPPSGDGRAGSCPGAGSGGTFASMNGAGGTGTAGRNKGAGGGGGGAGYPHSGAGGTGADNQAIVASGGGGGGGQSFVAGPGVTGHIVHPGGAGHAFITITPIYDAAIKAPTLTIEAHTASYWKGLTSGWPLNTAPTQLLGSVYGSVASTSCPNVKASTTLATTLGLAGGTDLCGQIEHLMRTATAAYLNELAFTSAYPATSATALQSSVNTAVSTTLSHPADLAALTTLTAKLEAWNNRQA